MNETPQNGDSMATIEQGVGYTFADRSKLQLALTHRSFNGSENSSNLNNQRLEFLGDAVLQLVITHELFARYPEHEEGPLTKARAQLVNRRTLADLAKTIGLGPQLLMSRGEELSGGRERLSALADAFEALIGAVYLDSGFETTREFILQRFSDHFGKLEILPSLDNPKGELQELLQTSSNRPPHYELIKVNGPDHDRIFECAVVHNHSELGRGRGKSKKQAEFNAAVEALEKLKGQAQKSPFESQ